MHTGYRLPYRSASYFRYSAVFPVQIIQMQHIISSFSIKATSFAIALPRWETAFFLFLTHICKCRSIRRIIENRIIAKAFCAFHMVCHNALHDTSKDMTHCHLPHIGDRTNELTAFILRMLYIDQSYIDFSHHMKYPCP